MPRGQTSKLDHQLIRAVADQGAQISVYQIERWRTAGLIPRNTRRGLGRGLGTVATMAPEALKSVLTVVRGNMSTHGIVGAFYNAAGSGAGRLDQMAERTVRAACLSLVGSSHRSTMDLDQAYEYAHGRALLAQYYAGNASIVASPKWRAYEHVFAAEEAGVRPIGREFIEEAAIALRWATQEAAPILVDYLDATLCRSDEHVQILHRIDYRRFVDGAAVAANLLSAGMMAPHVISDSNFHWLLTLPEEYLSRLKMHLAVMMDEGLLDHAQDALVAVGRKEPRG